MSWLSDIVDYGSDFISNAYDNSYLESGIDSIFSSGETGLDSSSLTNSSNARDLFTNGSSSSNLFQLGDKYDYSSIGNIANSVSKAGSNVASSPSFWSNLGDSLLKPQVIGTGLQGGLGYLMNAQKREDEAKVAEYTKAQNAEKLRLEKITMVANLQKMQYEMQRSASSGSSSDMYARLNALNNSSTNMINALGNLATSFSRARVGR